MKLKYDFMIREVAGEYVLIPMGKSALNFSGMITTNAVGAFLCEQLKNSATEEELVKAVCREFEVCEETAEADLGDFLDMLCKAGLLENGKA